MLMLCPICAGEFQSRQAHCPTCGITLISSSFNDDSISEEKKEKRERDEFVELCRPRIYPVAMLIKQTLEHHDVTVLIQGGHSLSLLPHLAFGGELRVLVHSGQLEYA